MDEEIFEELQLKLGAALEAFRRDASKLRTGRANTGMLEGVRVEYYGAEMPLGQVATVTVADARLLQIKPWERTMCGPIEKAVLAANLGFTPSNRGDVVLVPIPTPTGDRRREMAKLLKGMAEDAKVSTRNARRDANEMLELIEDMPEDDMHKNKKKVQDLVDAAIKRIEQVAADKEVEILDVT